MADNKKSALLSERARKLGIILEGTMAVGIEDKGLTSLEIPEGITDLGIEAFAEMTALVRVKFPRSLKKIGDSAFIGCSALTEISIPGTVKTVADGAFSYCDSLSRVTFGEGVELIGDEAFYECPSLKNVRIASSVIEIGDSAFYHCPIKTAHAPAHLLSSLRSESLTELTVTDGECIDEYALADCTSLKRITLSASVTRIREGAFRADSALCSVVFLGTEAEWKSVKIARSNSALSKAAVKFSQK